MAPPTHYTALSRTDSEGAPLLGTCTMVLGDGTSRVEFKNGRAEVPAHLAHMVATHVHVDVVGWDGEVTPFPQPDAASSSTSPQVVADQAAEIQRLRAEVAAHEARANAVTLDAPGGGEQPGDPGEPVEPDGEVSEQVRLAMEHLREEGELVPEVQKAGPSNEGFEANTPDGQPRCQARKGDGGQCSNAASKGHACSIAKHQDELGEGAAKA